MKATRRWGCCLLLAACFPAHRIPGDEWFAPFEHVADYKPKGPTHCFRQFNVDWSWVSRRPEQLPEFLSRADPAALAEFCEATHIDGTIVMAVPHHGYCTYETRVGTKFPGMKGDWFGRTIDELHKRRIAAFGYVTLNWNWKFMRDHLGQEFIHARLQPDGSFDSGYICLNAPGYLELVEAYTREVLEGYPVDGMRWDILSTARECLCTGCKDFYRQTYGEDLIAWGRVGPRRVQDFDLATTRRAVTRLQRLCKQIKPSVEIRQNGLQSYHAADLDLGRQMDDRGEVLPDFALARDLGVSYVGTVTAETDLAVHGNSFSADRRRRAGIRQLVQVRSTSGETLLSVSRDGAQWPLLQLQDHAKGRVAYLASLDSLELMRDVIDWLSGSPPVTVAGHEGTQVVLTHQPAAKRWVLHLISDGDYAVEVRRDQVPATTVIDRYPPAGWTYRIERETDRLQIRVEGQAGDRLLVLE
jgi:Hypothetical glycosyl hydrolase 6